MFVKESLLCNAHSAKYVRERSTLNYTHVCTCMYMCTCMYTYVYSIHVTMYIMCVGVHIYVHVCIQCMCT